MSDKCILLDNPCVEHVLDPVRTSSSPFTVCVGTNSLAWDGQVLTLHKGTPIADGEYTAFTIRNGCIVSADQAPVPEYTPPPCVESPAPCDGSGTTSAVSPAAGNLTTSTSLGLYTRVYVQPGSGVAITGTGVVGDPIVISAAGGGGPVVMPTTSEIAVSTPTPGVIGIGLNPSGIPPGTYGGITFNSHGIATGYATPNTTSLVGVVGAAEIDADNQGGLVTVSLKPTPAGNASYNVGGYSATLTQGGTVSSMSRTINVPAGIYELGAYAISVTDHGSINGVQRIATMTPTSFTTSDGKTVNVDEHGYIISIT